MRKYKPYHRNPKPGDKIRTGIAVSLDTYDKIYSESVKHNLSMLKTVDVMVDFYQRNFILVEQLSLTSKGRII